MRFVDLFSGLGGFHVALSRLGHKCVFASEIDRELQDLYFLNFGIRPASDIRFSWKDVPEHDILCAGFPCQPFSKAGNQSGFDCPSSGDLFEYILKIVDRRSPKFLLLENVPNIIRHAGGATWRRIQDNLRLRGYAVDSHEISPHQIGIPQIRNRALIVACKAGLEEFEWPALRASGEGLHLRTVLEDVPSTTAAALPESFIRYLNVWEEFLQRIGDINKMPSFPIWAMEFGADYPYEDRNPTSYHHGYLGRFRGAFGEGLSQKSKDQQTATLPPYARDTHPFPSWKVRFIRQNREFFSMHQSVLADWLPKVREFPASFQKFEWNWQEGSRTVWDKVIQFRASGIRVKNPATAPSLVALTTSQVPVIAWQRRYMTVRECARLQSLDGLQNLPVSKTRAFKALGNAVNVEVVQIVAERLLAIDGNNVSPSQESQVAAISSLATA